MDPTDELFTKILNTWFHEEKPVHDINEHMRDFAVEIIRRAQYGDDVIFSHEKINEIILILKDYGIFEYDKSKLDLYFEGRMKYQIERRKYFNSPEVNKVMKALSNILGEMFKDIMKETEKQIEEENSISAIPHLASLPFFEN